MSAGAVLHAVIASPVPWSIAAGIFLGAAVSRAASRTHRRRNPHRARTAKWIFFCIYLSLAVLCGLGALFAARSGQMLDARLVSVGGTAAAISFLALRFKKSLGIPVVVLTAIAAAAVGLFLQSVRAFTGETEIAVVRVLSSGQDSMRLELIPRDSQPVLLTMEGEYFAPIVKVVIFDDLLVFLGAKTWYRFEGMTSFKLVKDGDSWRLRQGSTDFYLPKPPGLSETVWAFFEKHEGGIPGVKTAQIEMDLKKAQTPVREFATYAIVVRNDGGVEIVPRS